MNKNEKHVSVSRYLGIDLDSQEEFEALIERWDSEKAIKTSLEDFEKSFIEFKNCPGTYSKDIFKLLTDLSMFGMHVALAEHRILLYSLYNEFHGNKEKGRNE